MEGNIILVNKDIAIDTATNKILEIKDKEIVLSKEQNLIYNTEYDIVGTPEQITSLLNSTKPTNLTKIPTSVDLETIHTLLTEVKRSQNVIIERMERIDNYVTVKDILEILHKLVKRIENNERQLDEQNKKLDLIKRMLDTQLRTVIDDYDPDNW